MKRLTTLAATLLLSCLLALPALAVGQGNPTKQSPRKEQKLEHAKSVDESKAFKRQKGYVQKREAMKQRRDLALEIRESNIANNNPGNTGF